jgi:hypothetical protein
MMWGPNDKLPCPMCRSGSRLTTVRTT